MNDEDDSKQTELDDNSSERQDRLKDEPVREKEIGGRKGPEPTRFGDWEKNGRCIDF